MQKSPDSQLHADQTEQVSFSASNTSETVQTRPKKSAAEAEVPQTPKNKKDATAANKREFEDGSKYFRTSRIAHFIFEM